MNGWILVAQKAYEAYAESTGGKTYDGRNMPTWDELPERIRDAWQAAAKASVIYCDEIKLQWK